MAFGSTSSDNLGDNDSDGDLAEINMIPFIDVMLVLLVIFIVTAPLLTHAVRIDLPQASALPNPPPPGHVDLAIGADAQLFWNGQAITASGLDDRLRAAAAQTPQPELQLRAERVTPYGKVAEVMAAASRAGLSRIGFVTEPGR
jgi:biopolymer transport protein ExbD